MKMTKKTTVEVPLRTAHDFSRASANTQQFKTTVVTVTTATDLATLIKTLHAANRPYAAAILEGR